MSHHCHALGCNVKVPPHLHMHAGHWKMVPRRLQRALWAAYRPGQEDDKDPSAEYLRAAASCIRAVAEKEGFPPADIDAECDLYLSWADRLDPPAQGALL
jgi:hypothetical protein